MNLKHERLGTYLDLRRRRQKAYPGL